MIHLQPSRRPADYPGAAQSGTEGFKGAYPGDKPPNRHNSMGVHRLMSIARKTLIRGYLIAEYRIEIGPGSTAGVKVAVVNREGQLDGGDGAQSRGRSDAAEQVIAQRGAGADLGKLRGADRNTVVDTGEGHERLLADARYIPGNHQIRGRHHEQIECSNPDRFKTLGKNQSTLGTALTKSSSSDVREPGAGFECDRRCLR